MVGTPLAYGETPAGEVLPIRIDANRRLARGGYDYKGAERLTMAGAAQSATIPADSIIAFILAEGGTIRAACNVTADAASPIYVPNGSQVVIFLGEVTGLSVYGAGSTYANIVYYG